MSSNAVFCVLSLNLTENCRQTFYHLLLRSSYHKIFQFFTVEPINQFTVQSCWANITPKKTCIFLWLIKYTKFHANWHLKPFSASEVDAVDVTRFGVWWCLSYAFINLWQFLKSFSLLKSFEIKPNDLRWSFKKYANVNVVYWLSNISNVRGTKQSWNWGFHRPVVNIP